MTAACWYKSFSVNTAMKRITSGKFSGIWLNSVGFKNKTQALKHGRSNSLLDYSKNCSQSDS